MSVADLDRRAFLAHTVGSLAAVVLQPDDAWALPVLQGTSVRAAVIGLGPQGRAIVEELQKIPQVEIAAVCDVSGPRLEAAAGRLKSVRTFSDHRALLDAMTDVPAILVATPTHRHRAIVEDALAAGRHVYCEAPIASTVDDCRALAQAAQGAKTMCQAGFHGRSNPTYRRAQPLVATELRRLVSMYAQHQRKSSWRVPVPEGGDERTFNWRLDPDVSIGLAGELGAQQFDVAHWFRRSYPVRIQGRGAVRLHDDGRRVADSIELDLIWEDGVALRYQATLASSYGGTYELFTGVNGAIRLAWMHGWLFKEADAATQGWEVYAARQQFYGDEGIVLVADATKLAAQGQLEAGAGLPHPPLYYALMDFLKSVTEGAPVACTMDEGARATIVGILANQAVVSGAPVDVPGL
jgi:predicted dehydrogenase